MEEEPARKRFRIQSEAEGNAWELTEEMLQYVTEQFEIYIKEKDVKEEILDKNPIPKNMKKVRKLDFFLQKLMTEKKKRKKLSSN